MALGFSQLGQQLVLAFARQAASPVEPLGLLAAIVEAIGAEKFRARGGADARAAC